MSLRRTLPLVACLLSLFAAGCAASLRNALPPKTNGAVRVSQMPSDIRAVGLENSVALSEDFATALAAGGRKQACDIDGNKIVLCVLILSGGGSRGAYGAGFLKGWSASGTRPKFKIVTGVSTGALMAPLAFLGPRWDSRLEKAFTTIETDSDVVSGGSIVRLATADSYASSQPLKRRIAQFVDAELLRAIAREHRSGRRLYIGTTNLDAHNFTVWNMGAIAASGRPRRIAAFPANSSRICINTDSNAAGDAQCNPRQRRLRRDARGWRTAVPVFHPAGRDRSENGHPEGTVERFEG